MKMKKWFIVILFISFLVISSTVPCTQAKFVKILSVTHWTWEPEYSALENIAMKRVAWSMTLLSIASPFAVFRFAEPEMFVSEPNTISIQYLNRTEITIGAIDPITKTYKSMKGDDYRINSLFLGYTYTFDLETPEDVPQDAFIAHFDPQVLTDVGVSDEEFKIKFYMSSNIPKDASLPQNIRLRVNISKYTSFGNLYIPGRKEGEPRKFNILWTLGAMGMFGNPFGRYSGQTLYEYSSYVDIIIRLDRFHLLDISPLEVKEIKPNQLTYIPIEVQNLGSHIDSFNFRINNNGSNDIIVTPPPAITLQPNEKAITKIGVASAQLFYDPGTARDITIEAYSIYQPDEMFNNTATIITRGVYVAEANWIYFGFIGLITFIIAIFFFYFYKRRIEKIAKKPDKPWLIPEEKTYLDELKQQNREAYDQERLMMEEEYKSAMLWYKSYLNAFSRVPKKEKEDTSTKSGKVNTLFKKSEKIEDKTQKKTSEKKQSAFPKFFKKSEEKKPEKKVKKPTPWKEEIIVADSEKEKALEKIRREQDKQKKYF